MTPKGGTEILKEQLIAQLEPGSIDGINLIGSICHPSLIQKDKTNVVWQHLSYDQPNVQYMRDRKFVDSVDYFIYVSHWQYNKFREHYQIPEYKSFVIKNATPAFEVKPKSDVITPVIPQNKVKLLYTSTPWRGLAILIKAIDILNKTRDDFELDIYSSTRIYGSQFEESEKGKFDALLFDSLSTLLVYNKSDIVIKFVRSLINKMKDNTKTLQQISQKLFELMSVKVDLKIKFVSKLTVPLGLPTHMLSSPLVGNAPFLRSPSQRSEEHTSELQSH
mgnify:CR=1 FL=1